MVDEYDELIRNFKDIEDQTIDIHLETAEDAEKPRDFNTVVDDRTNLSTFHKILGEIPVEDLGLPHINQIYEQENRFSIKNNDDIIPMVTHKSVIQERCNVCLNSIVSNQAKK